MAGDSLMFDGLVSVAAAALEAGDPYVETQRVVKVCLDSVGCLLTPARAYF